MIRSAVDFITRNIRFVADFNIALVFNAFGNEHKVFVTGGAEKCYVAAVFVLNYGNNRISIAARGFENNVGVVY